jgi:hypothetical protein
MSRHFSDETLADYAGDALKPRKTARVSSHLSGCTTCQGRLAALKAVPNLLASVRYPPIPERLSSRIEMALASESSARLASEPQTEAGRRDLPARARSERRGWRMPVFRSPLVLRTVAATGAAVIVAGGGYEIVAHSSSGPSTSSGNAGISAPASHSSASGNAVGNAGRVTVGPAVTYHHNGHAATIKPVHSSTNFLAATLPQQASATITAQDKAKSSTAVPSATGQPANSSNTSSQSQAGLQACVNRIAAGRTVLLVDIARYEGKSATIIVTAQTARRAEVYAVGSGCSASSSDILAQQSLQR